MINVETIPVLTAVLAKMDEGLAVFDESGELLVANQVGLCCLKGHRVIKDTLETEVKLGDKSYTSKLFVVDHKKSSTCCQDETS